MVELEKTSIKDFNKDFNNNKRKPVENTKSEVEMPK